MTDAEFEVHVESLKEDGYTVLPDMLTNDECDAATEELERLKKDEERGGFECLFNKARVFERIYQLPDQLRVIRHFLGSDALLGAAHGRIIEPQERGGALHADGALTGHLRERSQAPADEGRRIVSHAMALNNIFCISEFTSTNGATRVVPGSHHIDSMEIPESAIEESRIIEAERGSVIVFISNIWHGTSKNTTTGKRYAVLAPWRRNWQKGAYELSCIVKPDVLERAGEEGRVIFGFDSRPPYLEHWQWDRETGEPKPEFVELRRD